MNNSLPEFTPEQLRQLNAISGLQKTRRRGADASVPSALTAESESGEAPDTSASYALPKPAPNMSEEDYERQIKEGLTEHIGAIYDRARQRADARRQETLARMDKGMDNASLWQQAWASYAKSQMLRSPSALGGEDTQLMQAAERALKILNQKTEKDKQAGDGTSGLTREIFDWQTLADFASLGTRELAENIVTTRQLKKAARSERLTPNRKRYSRIVPHIRVNKRVYRPAGRPHHRRESRQRRRGIAALHGRLCHNERVQRSRKNRRTCPYQERGEKPCRAGPA